MVTNFNEMVMNKIIYLLLIGAAAFFAGCNNDDDSLPVVLPEQQGTVEDSEGNIYKWVRYAGLDWLAANFRGGEPYYDAPGIDIGEWDDPLEIVVLGSAEEDLEIYGNLYTYAEALENASMLDDSEGAWRLPTDEDWQKLEQALGMSVKVAQSKGWRGAPAGELLCQDSTGSNLNFLLGGMVSGFMYGTATQWKLERMREYGYYWCDDVLESDYDKEGRIIAYRAIRYNTGEVERDWCTEGVIRGGYDVILPRYMSVRYVRDAKK